MKPTNTLMTKENQVQEIINKGRCEACKKQWLGHYWNKPLCNSCAIEFEAEMDKLYHEGEKALSESENYRIAHS